MQLRALTHWKLRTAHTCRTRSKSGPLWTAVAWPSSSAFCEPPTTPSCDPKRGACKARARVWVGGTRRPNARPGIRDCQLWRNNVKLSSSKVLFSSLDPNCIRQFEQLAMESHWSGQEGLVCVCVRAIHAQRHTRINGSQERKMPENNRRLGDVRNCRKSKLEVLSLLY